MHVKRAFPKISDMLVNIAKVPAKSKKLCALTRTQTSTFQYELRVLSAASADHCPSLAQL